MNAIEIKNLCKSYKDFKIDNLNLTLPGGYIMGLVGENGAGKSTTIKLILNMVHKDSGSITVLGKDNSDNFELTKEDIGVVLDEVGFSSYFNAKDINKIMSHTYKNWNSKQFYAYLERLSLPTDKKFKDLSRGMKMKLGIAVALSHDAKLLILDEATNGLDPVVRDEVTDLFMEFTRDENHSVLISSHIVSDLKKSVTILLLSIKERSFFVRKRIDSERIMQLFDVPISSLVSLISQPLSEREKMLMV